MVLGKGTFLDGMDHMAKIVNRADERSLVNNFVLSAGSSIFECTRETYDSWRFFSLLSFLGCDG